MTVGDNHVSWLFLGPALAFLAFAIVMIILSERQKRHDDDRRS